MKMLPSNEPPNRLASQETRNNIIHRHQNLPEGDGRCRILLIPGDGARLGGVALPRPESVSVYRYTILSWSVLEPVFYKQTHINNYIFSSQP
jgi:hypothetical protein